MQSRTPRSGRRGTMLCGGRSLLGASIAAQRLGGQTTKCRERAINQRTCRSCGVRARDEALCGKCVLREARSVGAVIHCIPS